MLPAICNYSSAQTFSLYNKTTFSLKPSVNNHYYYNTNTNTNNNNKQQLSLFTAKSNPLRLNLSNYSYNYSRGEMNKQIVRRFVGPVCYSPPLAPPTLQWVSTISIAVLMLAKGTGIQKSFLVPIFALQAPAGIVPWIKGEYGIWTAFLALLVRLFFYIPGELELPFLALLIVLAAPYQVLNLRGKQEGIILSLVIAGYLAFQHFSRAGSLRKAFDQGSIIATIAVTCVLVVPCLLLIRI